MFENRDLRTDLVALALAVLTLFLAVALLTYSPADSVAEALGIFAGAYQPDVLSYPQHETIHNACGRWGAVAADIVLNVFGVGGYFMVASLAVLAICHCGSPPVDGCGSD
jgi:S-DNA-T family DNA segregation ATPase FtsK/SpoIIIE